MKNLLKQVRDAIIASLTGMTPEQLAEERANQQLSKSVEDFLSKHSADDLKPVAANAAPITKKKRVVKSLGAGAGMFTPHEIDSDILERAREKCRQLVADNPDRYGDIITAAPIRGT